VDGLPWPALRGLLTEVVFPGRCLGCGEWLLLQSDHTIPVCRDCLRLLPEMAEPRCTRCGIELVSEIETCLRCRSTDYRFHWHLSLFPYTGMAKRLLQGLKFSGRRRLAAFFASRLAASIAHRGGESVIVPAPSRPRRKTPDAVELIARKLESDHGLRVLRLLERSTSTQQKSLDYEQRRENLQGGIRMNPRYRGPVPLDVMLMDDVFTTGATLDACAEVLRAAGCREVNALTIVMEE
jgi:ComF family protein